MAVKCMVSDSFRRTYRRNLSAQVSQSLNPQSDGPASEQQET
jgi:hypothetical protein